MNNKKFMINKSYRSAELNKLKWYEYKRGSSKLIKNGQLCKRKENMKYQNLGLECFDFVVFSI